MFSSYYHTQQLHRSGFILATKNTQEGLSKDEAAAYLLTGLASVGTGVLLAHLLIGNAKEDPKDTTFADDVEPVFYQDIDVERDCRQANAESFVKFRDLLIANAPEIKLPVDFPQTCDWRQEEDEKKLPLEPTIILAVDGIRQNLAQRRWSFTQVRRGESYQLTEALNESARYQAYHDDEVLKHRLGIFQVMLETRSIRKMLIIAKDAQTAFTLTAVKRPYANTKQRRTRLLFKLELALFRAAKQFSDIANLNRALAPFSMEASEPFSFQDQVALSFSDKLERKPHQRLFKGSTRRRLEENEAKRDIHYGMHHGMSGQNRIFEVVRPVVLYRLALDGFVCLGK